MSYCQLQNVNVHVCPMSIVSYQLCLLNILLCPFLVTIHCTSAIIILSATILNVDIMFLQNIHFKSTMFSSVVLQCMWTESKKYFWTITFTLIFCRNLRHTSRPYLFACSSVTSSAILQKLIFSYKTSQNFSLKISAITLMILFWILGDIYRTVCGPLKK